MKKEAVNQKNFDLMIKTSLKINHQLVRINLPDFVKSDISSFRYIKSFLIKSGNKIIVLKDIFLDTNSHYAYYQESF
jgi:hypothetical protein